MKKRVYLIFSSIIFLNCSDDIVSECEKSIDDLPSFQKMTFTDIQEQIFNPSCVSCHSGTRPSGGLDLTESESWNNLVNVNSATSSYKLVVPYDSENSYLYLVLDGTSAPLMPPNGRIGQAKIDSVASWIDRGAPQN